jgi:pimeloyl-ACP methyl ester carboxylesterase
VQRISRALGAALVSSGLVFGGVGVADARTQEAPAQDAVGKIAWHPCPADATAECGTLRLPVDWAQPRGEGFDLAVARRKATDQGKRTGVLLINPGGPGGSGVDFALGAKRVFSPEVQARFDIIGFDPRGVARSQPVKCSLAVLQRAPSSHPRDQAEFDQLVAFNRELRDDCRRNSGPIFDHADTLAVVQDVDALRRALGEREINYYGVSYGTLIGQQYAERYGDRIRAMVVDSNMDHSLGTRQFAETEAATAEDSFTEFVKWCDRTQSCALHGKDVAQVWDDLLVRADRGEVTDPNHPDRKLTSDDILQRAFGAFYGPAWSPLASYVAQLDAQKPVPAPAFAAAGDTAENPFPAVFCQDWDIRVQDYEEFARLAEREKRIAPHMRGSSLGHSAIVGCIGWPEELSNPQHRLRISEAPKILMLNAVHDPATAYPWAVNAHRQAYRETSLVTYEGWGHGVYGRSECTNAVVDAYLGDLTVPRDGTRCAAVEPSDFRTASADARTPAGPKPGVPGWTR